jgi:hypothetical protein
VQREGLLSGLDARGGKGATDETPPPQPSPASRERELATKRLLSNPRVKRRGQASRTARESELVAMLPMRFALQRLTCGSLRPGLDRRLRVLDTSNRCILTTIPSQTTMAHVLAVPP